MTRKKKTAGHMRDTHNAGRPKVMLMIIIPRKPGAPDDSAARVLETTGESAKPVLH